MGFDKKNPLLSEFLFPPKADEMIYSGASTRGGQVLRKLHLVILHQLQPQDCLSAVLEESACRQASGMMLRGSSFIIYLPDLRPLIAPPLERRGPEVCRLSLDDTA